MSKGSNILNYTTTVEAGRTIGEIISLLVQKRATSINTDYDNGKATAITFVIRVGEALVPFRMTPNVLGVAKKLPNPSDKDRAERVAWRIMLRWVESQMAMVDSNQAEIAQVFLPYAVVDNGETLWKAFQTSKTLQIGSGVPLEQPRLLEAQYL